MVLSGGVFHFAQSSAYTAGQIPFASSTSAIGFSSNLFWDSANNRLGIGTASPSVDLEVGDSTGTRTIKIAGNTSILNLGYGTIRSGSSVGDVRILTDRFRIYNEAGTQIALNVASTGATDWYTNNGLKMTLDASGNLGLGVTPSTANTPTLQSPYGHIAGVYQFNALANAYYNGGWKYTGVGAASVYRQDAGSHAWYSAASGGAGSGGTTITDFNTAKMTLDASGNLGIGVTTVGERIHASGNIKAAGNAGTFPRFISEVGAKSWATGYRSGTTSFEIWEDSTTRLAIANGGQVQVGINGTASVPAIALAANPDTGLYWPTNSDTLALAVGGSDAVYIDSSRNVGIGTSSGLLAKLDIVGASQTGSSTNFSTKVIKASFATFGGPSPIASVLAFYDFGVYVADIGISYSGGSDNLIFSVNSSASSGAPTERLRIKGTGQLNFSSLGSDPTGAAGDLYYSTSNVLKLHNGTAWQQVSRKYTTALSSTGTSFTVTHNLGTRDVTVQVRKSGSTYDVVYTDIQMTTTDTVTVIFASSVTGSDYTVTVIG
jgi:hypothetical protein